MSKESGWSELSNIYSLKNASIQIKGVKFKSLNGILNDKAFNRAIKVGANEAGVILNVPFVVSFGHPALFFPWDVLNISDSPEANNRSDFINKLMNEKYYYFLVKTHPNFKLLISEESYLKTSIPKYLKKY